MCCRGTSVACSLSVLVWIDFCLLFQVCGYMIYVAVERAARTHTQAALRAGQGSGAVASFRGVDHAAEGTKKPHGRVPSPLYLRFDEFHEGLLNGLNGVSNS